MGRIHRYRTALSRRHRSGGFGIHSPFAFNFVLNVLRERRPYYAYEELMHLRSVAAQEAKLYRHHPAVITGKNAKMLFRITNFFKPAHILHVGIDYGVSAAATLLPDSRTTCTLLAQQPLRFPVTRQVLERFEGRITTFADLDEAFAHYAHTQQVPFIVIDRIFTQQQLEALSAYLQGVQQGEAVVIIRNIANSSLMKQLWEHTKNQLQHGHTYTNEKLAVIVARPTLPLQHFLLWF